MLTTLTFLLPLLPLALGLNALIRPDLAMAVFQFPIPSDPYAQTLALNLMRIYGARNTAIGLSCLAMRLEKQWRALGWLFLSTSIMAATDGVVTKAVLGPESGIEWSHWCFLPVSVGFGVWMLRK